MEHCVVNVKLTQAGFQLTYSANQADALPIELSSRLGRAQVQIHIWEHEKFLRTIKFNIINGNSVAQSHMNTF